MEPQKRKEPLIRTNLKEIKIEYGGETYYIVSENLKNLFNLQEALSEIAKIGMKQTEKLPNTGELNKMTKVIHENAVKHGWWEGVKNFGEIIALCHSELSEALEEYRNANPDVYFIQDGKMQTDLSLWRGEKLEGIVTELADCIIRILDYCGHRKADIQKVIEMKHFYNESRPYKHGGKKC